MHINSAIHIAGVFCRAVLTGIHRRIICAYFPPWLQDLWYSPSQRYAPTRENVGFRGLTCKSSENFHVFIGLTHTEGSALRREGTVELPGLDPKKVSIGDLFRPKSPFYAPDVIEYLFFW